MNFKKIGTASVGLFVLINIITAWWLIKNRHEPIDDSLERIAAQSRNAQIEAHPVIIAELNEISAEELSQSLKKLAQFTNYLHAMIAHPDDAGTLADFEHALANRRTWKVLGELNRKYKNKEEAYQVLDKDFQERFNRYVKLSKPRLPIVVEWRPGMDLNSIAAELETKAKKELGTTDPVYDPDRERLGICSSLFLLAVFANHDQFNTQCQKIVQWNQSFRKSSKLFLTEHPQPRSHLESHLNDRPINDLVLISAWIINQQGLDQWQKTTALDKILDNAVEIQSIKPITKWDTKFSSYDPLYYQRHLLNPAEVIYHLPIFQWAPKYKSNQPLNNKMRHQLLTQLFVINN